LPADCLHFKIFTEDEMRTCQYCQKELTKPTQKLYCSPVCAMRNFHKSGQAAGKRFVPNGGKVTVICSTCGEPYQIWRYQLTQKHHYCSKQCFSIGCSGNKGAQVKLYCAWCHKPFIKLRCQISQNEQRRKIAKKSLAYCSPECQHLGLANLYSPDERSGYVDGRTAITAYYVDSASLLPLKKQIKERDGFACKLCGSKAKLVIHHIDHDRLNNASSNLITLCNSCNTRERWHRVVFEPILALIAQELSGT
jgi:5-methylcytosine-specific restriction endonuclease McrA